MDTPDHLPIAQHSLEGFESSELPAPKKKRGRPPRKKITPPTEAEPLNDLSLQSSGQPIPSDGLIPARPKRGRRPSASKAQRAENEGPLNTEHSSTAQKINHEPELIRFEYAPTPPPSEDWQPGSSKKEDRPIYTGLPIEETRPALPLYATTESFRNAPTEESKKTSEGLPKEEVRPETPSSLGERSQAPQHQRHKNGKFFKEREAYAHHPKHRQNFNPPAKAQHSVVHPRGGQQANGKKDRKASFHEAGPRNNKKRANAFWSADARGSFAMQPNFGELPYWDVLQNQSMREAFLADKDLSLDAFDFNAYYAMSLYELSEALKGLGIEPERIPSKKTLLRSAFKKLGEEGRLLKITGLLEVLENGHGLLVYQQDSYAQYEFSAFVHKSLVEQYGLGTGHMLSTLALPPREQETTAAVLRIDSVFGESPEELSSKTPFHELTPYYPLERILLENGNATWDNNSMRVVDLLTPMGLGQRGLIVAPPRVGKTVLLQNIAHAIAANKPDAHLIVLLIDERPEEVTDFRRHVKGEVIASTFDQSPECHIHAAEMVIAKARRMVEGGKDVIILLDSITRLARAYNTLMPNSGKILSGGVEANALERPKRFFGSARNIEGGGSLTILGSALIETGSKMDEVIFEEFKGTGNMELHLDRALAEKRVFPALNFEKSGTRKEELLYHPDELNKIYALRRAMKGVPAVDAMEMLIQRVKKTKSNPEFLVSMSR